MVRDCGYCNEDREICKCERCQNCGQITYDCACKEEDEEN
jgi:hypothetical protein